MLDAGPAPVNKPGGFRATLLVMPQPIAATALVERYEVVLLDAYGVLVDGSGALPDAADFVTTLRVRDHRFLVVTNDASRLPATVAGRMNTWGIPVDPDQVLTSGRLLAPYFAANELAGARCLVLGTADSCTYVEEAGGEVVAADADTDYDAVVICDDAGYPFLETIEIALTVLYRSLGRGDDVALVLPNPDLVYPKRAGAFGFTAGSVALLLEAALERRFPGRDLRFARLGKPHLPIFEEARRRAGTPSVVMIGDQIETDIAGARAAGIDAALLTGGVSRWEDGVVADEHAPTWLLNDLSIE
jgi:HAD superfamily hydrolase (TIGR01450 family)